MSFTGTLVSIEPDGRRRRVVSRPSAEDPDSYPVWKITVQDGAVVRTAHTGRTDIVERGRALIGQFVHVLRGGKEGVVGGIESREEYERFHGGLQGTGPTP